MNWINKIKKFGESIKKNINKKFPTKSERETSAWTSCCKGPILKSELEENLFVCPHCNKHHRISPIQRFDIIFGKNNYEILKHQYHKMIHYNGLIQNIQRKTWCARKKPNKIAQL